MGLWPQNSLGLMQCCFAVAAGPNWGKYYVWPCQWGNLIGALISFFIQAGLSFKVSD